MIFGQIKLFNSCADEQHYPPDKKPRKERFPMIKTWLQNFLGISKIHSMLHNMDSDVMCLIEKQLNPLVTLPPDPPEYDENSPYEYLNKDVTSAIPGTILYAPEWYCVWKVGFAGPFESEQDAINYSSFNKIGDCHIKLLRRCGFKMK